LCWSVSGGFFDTFQTKSDLENVDCYVSDPEDDSSVLSSPTAAEDTGNQGEERDGDEDVVLQEEKLSGTLVR